MLKLVHLSLLTGSQTKINTLFNKETEQPHQQGRVIELTETSSEESGNVEKRGNVSDQVIDSVIHAVLGAGPLTKGRRS